MDKTTTDIWIEKNPLCSDSFHYWKILTPIIAAAQRGYMEIIEIIKALLVRGCSIEAQSGDGSTPIFWASEANQVEAMELLLKSGANGY